MNTIVLGFKSHSNGRGVGQAALVAGPEISGHEQAKMVALAKSKNDFPKGISLLQMVSIAPRITAIEVVTPEPKPETTKKIETKKETK